MSTQTSELHSQPQADGDSRPFDLHGHTGPVLVHTEKRGPAFDAQSPISQQLMRSMQADALTATGELFDALYRRPYPHLKEVFGPWRRLLTAMGLSITPVHVRGICTPETEKIIVWDTLRWVVIQALAHANQFNASIKWLNADVLMRAAARQKQKELTARLLKPVYENGEPLPMDAIAMLIEDAELYRAFAEDEVA